MPPKRGVMWAAVLAAQVSACVDSSGPAGIQLSEPVSLQAAVAFSSEPAAGELAELSRARITAIDSGRDSVLTVSQSDLDPNADAWEFDITIDVTAARAIPVILRIELASVDSAGGELVQWSGLSPVVTVGVGLELLVVTEIRAITVYRGPVDNLPATSVTLAAPAEIVFPAGVTLTAEIENGGPGARAFFESLDPSVATVDPLTGIVETQDTGSVRMIARAGRSADTASFHVAAPTVLADAAAITIVSRAVDYYGSPDFVVGMQDSEGAQNIALRLRSLALEMASGDVLDAARAYRDALETLGQYAEGSEPVRQQDAPQLSLIDFSLIIVGDALGISVR